MRFTITAAVLGLAALAGAGAALAASFADVHIAPGGEQVLAGGAGDFMLGGQNVGDVAVRIVSRERGADRVLATVAPGERIEQAFAGRESAVAVNASASHEAVLLVHMSSGNGHHAVGAVHGRYEEP